MFVVPANTPGVDIVRDVARWMTRRTTTGASEHAEIRYVDVRIPAEPLGPEGSGFFAGRRARPGRSITACVGSAVQRAST